MIFNDILQKLFTTILYSPLFFGQDFALQKHEYQFALVISLLSFPCGFPVRGAMFDTVLSLN
jgi:hypothetical protein